MDTIQCEMKMDGWIDGLMDMIDMYGYGHGWMDIDGKICMDGCLDMDISGYNVWRDIDGHTF